MGHVFNSFILTVGKCNTSKNRLTFTVQNSALNEFKITVFSPLYALLDNSILSTQV